jgi:hypothetical protein
MNELHRLRDFWADLHPFIRFTVLLLVVALLLAIPLALQMQWGFKSSQRAAEAAEAMKNGNAVRARELALSVLAADNKREDLLPLLMRAMDELKDPRRGEVAIGILRQPGRFSDEERLAAWDCACRSLATGKVQALRAQLTAVERNSPPFLGRLIDRYVADGSSDLAAELLEQQRHPLPPELHQRLMALLVKRGSVGALEHFQHDLLKRLETGAPGTEALIPLLDEIPQDKLYPGLLSALAAQSDDSPAARGRLARLEMAADPDAADVIFTRSLRGQDRAGIARWCLLAGRPAEAIGALVAETGASTPESWSLVCQAWEALGDLDAWAAELKNPPAGAFMPAVMGDRALVATRSGDPAAAADFIQAALASARQSVADDAMIRLARHAEERGMAELAKSAWLEAIAQRRGPLPLGIRFRELIDELVTERREADLFNVFSSYHALEPGNPVFTIQNAYLSCLTARTDPQAVIEELYPLSQSMPDLLQLRCVLALAHLIQHDWDEALRLTQLPLVDWQSVNPGYRVIRALALRSSDPERSAALLEGLDWETLLPSEKRVLGALLQFAP